MAWHLKPSAIPIRKAVLPALVMVVAAATILFQAWYYGSRININAQLEIGMTEKEVINLLGGPPNHDPKKSPDIYYGGFSTSPKAFSKIHHYRAWESGEGVLRVYFDKSGELLFCQRGIWDRPPTLAERVRDFLRSLF